MSAVHLHRDDCPYAVSIVHAVRGMRDWIPGVEDTGVGFRVDVDDLGFLSSTEKASIRLAVNLAAFERQGPPSTAVAHTIRHAVNEATR